MADELAHALFGLIADANVKIIVTPNPKHPPMALDLHHLKLTLAVAEETLPQLTLKDFIAPLDALGKQQANNNSSIGLATFLSLTILVKYQVLADDLKHSVVYLQQTQILEPVVERIKYSGQIGSKSKDSKPTRRRASLHRANLQLAKKRTATSQHANNLPDLLTNLHADCSKWDQQIVATSIHKLNLAFNSSCIFECLQQIMIHHHNYGLLIDSHIKRTLAWVYSHIETNHYIVVKNIHTNQSENDPLAWIKQQFEHIKDKYCNYYACHVHLSKPSLQHSLLAGCCITRERLQMYMEQSLASKSDNALEPTVSAVFGAYNDQLFEPAIDVYTQLIRLINGLQDLVDHYWQGMSQDAIQRQFDNEQDKRQYHLEQFYYCQGYKTLLINFAMNIDRVAMNLGRSNEQVKGLLQSLQQCVLTIISTPYPSYLSKHASLKVVISSTEQQRIQTQLKQQKFAMAYVALANQFDALIASYHYSAQSPLDDIQLADIKRQIELSLTHLVQGMDQGYANWYQTFKN